MRMIVTLILTILCFITAATADEAEDKILEANEALLKNLQGGNIKFLQSLKCKDKTICELYPDWPYRPISNKKPYNPIEMIQRDDFKCSWSNGTTFVISPSFEGHIASAKDFRFKPKAQLTNQLNIRVILLSDKTTISKLKINGINKLRVVANGGIPRRENGLFIYEGRYRELQYSLKLGHAPLSYDYLAWLPSELLKNNEHIVKSNFIASSNEEQLCVASLDNLSSHSLVLLINPETVDNDELAGKKKHHKSKSGEKEEEPPAEDKLPKIVVNEYINKGKLKTFNQSFEWHRHGQIIAVNEEGKPDQILFDVKKSLDTDVLTFNDGTDSYRILASEVDGNTVKLTLLHYELFEKKFYVKAINKNTKDQIAKKIIFKGLQTKMENKSTYSKYADILRKKDPIQIELKDDTGYYSPLETIAISTFEDVVKGNSSTHPMQLEFSPKMRSFQLKILNNEPISGVEIEIKYQNDIIAGTGKKNSQKIVVAGNKRWHGQLTLGNVKVVEIRVSAEGYIPHQATVPFSRLLNDYYFELKQADIEAEVKVALYTKLGENRKKHGLRGVTISYIESTNDGRSNQRTVKMEGKDRRSPYFYKEIRYKPGTEVKINIPQGRGYVAESFDWHKISGLMQNYELSNETPLLIFVSDFSKSMAKYMRGGSVKKNFASSYAAMINETKTDENIKKQYTEFFSYAIDDHGKLQNVAHEDYAAILQPNGKSPTDINQLISELNDLVQSRSQRNSQIKAIIILVRGSTNPIDNNDLRQLNEKLEQLGMYLLVGDYQYMLDSSNDSGLDGAEFLGVKRKVFLYNFAVNVESQPIKGEFSQSIGLLKNRVKSALIQQ